MSSRCGGRSLGFRCRGRPTAATVQLREIVERLITAGQWYDGDSDTLVVLDSRYDAPRIAHRLAGLPVEILGRLRSDRVMRRPTPPHVYDPQGGRPPKHASECAFCASATLGDEHVATVTDTRLYGKATANRPRSKRRSSAFAP
ncbi:transposase [Streptomyces milbemycinicus]|uniref:transposase n=1 Tax=Streptomyces milbemycinicus TaxID=476552 RepID=UPI003F4D625F